MAAMKALATKMHHAEARPDAMPRREPQIDASQRRLEIFEEDRRDRSGAEAAPMMKTAARLTATTALAQKGSRQRPIGAASRRRWEDARGMGSTGRPHADLTFHRRLAAAGPGPMCCGRSIALVRTVMKRIYRCVARAEGAANDTPSWSTTTEFARRPPRPGASLSLRVCRPTQSRLRSTRHLTQAVDPTPRNPSNRTLGTRRH